MGEKKQGGKPVRTIDWLPCMQHEGGCPNRAPGCQDKCLELLAVALVNGAQRRKARSKREAELAADGCNIAMCRKRSRRKINER